MLHIEQPLRRRDLPAQRGLLHRGHDHITAQGKVGGLELKAGALLLRLGHLDRAARGTEHIGHVAQCELRRVKIVGVIRCRGGSGQRADGILRADAAEAALEVRKKSGALREIELMRLAQGRLGRADIGICLERLFDQPIELGRAKQGPPLTRDIHVR